MKRSEKLLDIIGQIDGRLVWEAERMPRESRKKRPAFRWQGALAACAALAVCAGAFGIAARQGVSPEIEKEQAAEIERAADASAAAVPEAASAKEGRMQKAQAPSVAARVEESGAGALSVSLQNSMQAVLSYGDAYTLERFQGEEWQEVVPSAVPDAAEENLYSLAAGETAELTVELESRYGALPAGRYRMVKACSLLLESGETQPYALYVEFEITE